MRFVLSLLLLSAFLLRPLPGCAQHPAHEARHATAPVDRPTEGTLADTLSGLLRVAGELDTPLGLDLLLSTATAHDNNNQDSTAMAMLLYVREQSHRRQLWATYAASDLALAHLYQKMGRRESAEEALEDAKKYIETYALESIYPVYALRKSYWIRSFSKDRDSAIHYAREAIRTAPVFADSATLTSGYMLMGFLTDIYPEQSISYFRRGIALCRETGDHVGASYMFSGLATRMIAQERYQQALAYNDSSILAAHQAPLVGQERAAAFSDALQARGEIYYSLGKLDSAYYYMHEGHDLEIDNLKELEHQKAIEVDARYNDQLKAARIAEQARQLRDEERQVRLLLVVVGLVLVLGFVLACITVRFRKLNRKNREQAEELRNLDAVKSHFFANVSHELRTPLTLIQGPISSMRQDDNLTDRQRRLLELAIGSSNKLRDLINQILELQKLEAGMPELAPAPTLLLDYFRHCLEAFSTLAQQKDLAYYREVSIPPTVVALLDREKCRIILANLLANAFKFTPEGGEVSVTIAFEDGLLTIGVSDTGPGIHADDLPHVFNRFYQTRQADRPAEGGSGIGLALCKEYVGLFGGTIDVKSRVGAGTSFSLSFPLAALPATVTDEGTGALALRTSLPVERKAIRREVGAGGDKPRILVVEDNTDLQEYLDFILSPHYRVETADHGKMALERLAGLPDCRLVLSDIMMPVMDGYELLDRLKGSDATRHLPVIMLTARGGTGDRLRALRIGVDDYLTKPFEEEELLVRIANLLRHQEARSTAEPPEPATRVTAPEDPPAPRVSAADREWLTAFEDYVRAHYADELLTVPLLAQEFAMSESTLLRQMKRLTGLTTLQYLQEVRLSEARTLLDAENSPAVSAVAAAVGYRDARSFSRAFKKRYGKLPSEYKEEGTLS